MLPFRTHDEHHLLIHQLEASTKQHGSVRLDINRRRWTVTANHGPGEACASCTRWADNLPYRFEARSLCGPCAVALCADGRQP